MIVPRIKTTMSYHRLQSCIKSSVSLTLRAHQRCLHYYPTVGSLRTSISTGLRPTPHHPLKSLKQTRQISISSLPRLPGTKRRRVGRGPAGGKRSGRGMKGYAGRNRRRTPYRSFQGGTNLVQVIPKLGKRQLPRNRHMSRISLDDIACWIRRGKLDTSQPITIGTLLRNGCINNLKRFGSLALLGGRDASSFKYKIDIEVSRASDSVIKAIERNGGRIVTRYFDEVDLQAIKRPAFRPFVEGVSVPTETSLLRYYLNPQKRGYLHQIVSRHLSSTDNASLSSSPSTTSTPTSPSSKQQPIPYATSIPALTTMLEVKQGRLVLKNTAGVGVGRIVDGQVVRDDYYAKRMAEIENELLVN